MIKVNTSLLSQRRESMGLLQRDVAEKVRELGITTMTDNHYSRIERGLEGYANVKVETGLVICQVLGFKIEEIFTFVPSDPVISEIPELDKLASGKALREARKEAGLSAEEIAKNVEGLSAPYIYNIEKGLGSPKAIETLANYLKVDLQNFYKYI